MTRAEAVRDRLRCPICARFVRPVQPCRATEACRRAAVREDVRRYRDFVARRASSWPAHVRARLREMTPEQREAIRMWVDLIDETPESCLADARRALDEVRP